MTFDFPEGATPIDDCSGLILTWVHNLEDLNRVEAESIIKRAQHASDIFRHLKTQIMEITNH